jgi:glycosyltransferase involved in cell wall biosynthesis
MSHASNAHPQSDIAVVLHDLRGGGAERAMLRLTKGFLEAGRRVDLVLFQAAGEYLSDVPAGARLVDLKARRVLGGTGALAAYFRRARPVAVVSAHAHVNVVAVAARALAGGRMPLLVSERNQTSQKAAEARDLRTKLTYAALPLAYARASKVVAVSQGVADDVAAFARLARSHVAVVHNPVFDETLEARLGAAPAHPWLVDGGAPVVLAVGRLEPQKDFDTLIRAVARVRAQTPARLLILGEGRARTALAERGGALGFGDDALSMPGFDANPLPYMARCATFALSSRYEGFPNVLAEALAAGAPIVSTDCPSGPREILDGGAYGALVPVGDDAALGAAIAAALRDPPDRARQRARGERFSVQAAAQRYLALMDAA